VVPFCPGAENAPKIVSKLLEFADLQGVAISTEEKAMLEILQAKLKDRKEDVASITLPKLHETCALLDRLAAALPVERCVLCCQSMDFFLSSPRFQTY
jgi:hypothetical protein